jgi:hypothetical protein
MPQLPAQVSLHFELMHAKCEGQSALRTHSGRQDSYGSPKKLSLQTQEPTPFLSKHSALWPQGFGWHGVTLSL